MRIYSLLSEPKNRLKQKCPTISEYSGGEGHFVKFSLSWGLQHQYFRNYFVLNSYESYTIKSQELLQAVYNMFCSLNLYKKAFFIPIHVHVFENLICYAFEGNINAGSWSCIQP